MIQIETTPNPNSLKFLSENIISAIGTEEFQKNKINKLMNDKAYLLEILRKGAEKARIKAEENLKIIREKVGLI